MHTQSVTNNMVRKQLLAKGCAPAAPVSITTLGLVSNTYCTFPYYHYLKVCIKQLCQAARILHALMCQSYSDSSTMKSQRKSGIAVALSQVSTWDPCLGQQAFGGFSFSIHPKHALNTAQLSFRSQNTFSSLHRKCTFHAKLLEMGCFECFEELHALKMTCTKSCRNGL